MKSHTLILEHAIDIVLPFKIFDKNFKDFRSKHNTDQPEEWFIYGVNSDGKFRMELRHNADDENYAVRISGVKSAGRRPTLHLRRIYFNEEQTFQWTDDTTDFFDLLETWAVDHKGCVFLKYFDFEEKSGHILCVDKGLLVEPPHLRATFPAEEEVQLLHDYGHSRRS